MIRRLLPFAVLSVLAFGAFGCSSSDPTPSGSTDTGTTADTNTTSDSGGDDTSSTLTVQVGQGGTVFVPATLNIKPGQTVTWVWAAGGHSVTSGDSAACTPDGVFDSTVLTVGSTFTHKFDTAGTFNYFCTPHCSFGMKGTVTVAP